MGDESVKVAVRVRPFNQREKDRGAKCIIKMIGQKTMIADPDQPNSEPKEFSFDFSYWSHDKFTEDSKGILQPVAGGNYSSQRMVFEDLGQGVLNNAFEGYNCSLFAYGQTGSGKSFSMVGYGPNKGIVPITCDELFKTMGTNKDPNKRFEVTFSMLEIYNEQVRDLLTKDNRKGGLPVRQNPKLGFYVQDLKKVPVGSYVEIEKRTDQGTENRTVASTAMNATSSRAHTVVTITFDQITKDDLGDEIKKSSVMNLVDLAGSERADSTGATGDRLKEGANINKSLSALGNVISALADLSMGKKKIMVPYRDSVLTKLLQNALGGNSKTIMIAALSPADINYDETLGTLRYADRAKKIKNKAVINENPMDKLIRELREENEKLKKSLEGGGVPVNSGAGLSKEEIEKLRHEMEEEIRSQLAANAEAMTSWDDRRAAATEEIDKDVSSKSTRVNKEPHIKNLNEDPALSGHIIHFIGPETSVGKLNSSATPDIGLSGISIMADHALLTVEGNGVEMKPGSNGTAKIKVNGQPVTGPIQLNHKDRILFGSNHWYVFYNPLNPVNPEDVPDKFEDLYLFSQKEVAAAKGYGDLSGSGGKLTKEQQIAQEQVLEILPMVSEVNAISEELDKHRLFEVILISAAAQGDQGKGTKVMVKMKNLQTSNTWLWERGKFMNRRYLVQELYQRFLDGDEDVNKIPEEEDPFWEPAEDVLIGTSNAFLQSLAYKLDFDDKLSVTDYKGIEEGSVLVFVSPCDSKGKALSDEEFVEEPSELLGKQYNFKVTVKSADIHKARFAKGVFVQYKVGCDIQGPDTDFVTTKSVQSLSPEFNHTKIFNINSINQEHIEFFNCGCITFEVYGRQEDSVPDPKIAKMTTKELRQREEFNNKADLQRRDTKLDFDASTIAEQRNFTLASKCLRLESKEKRMQEICNQWKNKPASQQDYEAFYRAVSACAFSTGKRLKTRVQVMNKTLQAFKFVKGADSNIMQLNKGGGSNGTAANGGNHAVVKGGKNAEEKEGSRACVIQ